MRKKSISSHLDLLGIVASMTCALHCAAVPILLTMGTLGGMSWISNPEIEQFFLVVSALIAAVVMINGYFKDNIGIYTLIAFLVGFTLLVVGSFLHHDHVHEGGYDFVITAVGGISVALAHFFNLFSEKQDCSITS